MKKLLIPLIVFSITSCSGGSTNQPQGGNTAAPTTNTPPTTVPDEETAPSAISAEETAIDAPDCLDALPKNPDKQVYHFEEFNKQEGRYIRHLYYAYPMTKGGYFVIHTYYEPTEDCSTSIAYNTYTYNNDGKLHKIDNVLPVLGIEYLLNDWNPSSFPTESKELTELFKKRQNDFASYVFKDDEPIIRTGLQRLKDAPEWKNRYNYLMGDYYDRPAYRWDGEMFVACDIFDEFLKSLPKSPDKPFYCLKDFYIIMEKELCFQHDYFAYPMTKGGYMVLSRCVISEEYSDDDDKCDSYTYQNGRLDTARNVLPVPDINEWLDPTKCKDHDSDVQNAIKAYQTERDNLSYEIDEKTGNITPYRAGYNENWSESYSELLKQLEYTWNGEQFVQQ